MKQTLFKSSVATLLMFLLIAQSFAATPLSNLVVGVGPISEASNWSGFSALNLIPGSSILPVTSTTVVLYVGFTGGTQADIGNMVLYKTTGRGLTKISSVTPVKLGGVSNPSIVLTDTNVCPVQPVSLTNPCIVRLDPITLTLSVTSDYWFVMFLTADSNNSSLFAPTNEFPSPSLTGFFEGVDDTRLTPGQSVPNSNSGQSYFLIAVMNN
jgi:hypothetical protein